MCWRGNRKVPVQPTEVKRLKKLLKECKNSTENKRINIMIVYLWWKDNNKTSKILWVSKATVSKTIDRYIKDKKTFYKTNYKWKIETTERKQIKKEAKEIAEKMIENNENPDINWILRRINQKHQKEVLTYHWMWRILRKRHKYNYQKPFVKNKKQSKHAEKIVKWRLTKAVIEVQMEENIDVDPVAIKNKKIKIWGGCG